MQSHTLLLVNTLLFSMYAGVVFVSARISGGSKAAAWFSGASLAWALAMAGRLAAARSPMALFVAGSSILMVGGLVMLHRSFAELLDRGKLLWRLQGVLLLVAAAGSIYFSQAPSAYPAADLLLGAVLGIQTALIASAVFSFSGEGVQSAGWFTGVALSAYAVIHLMRVAVTLRYGSAGYVEATGQMEVIWLCGMLLASSATAFGFFFLATGKLRLELLWRAQIDELTGLLNRWAFKRIAVKETFRSMRMRGRLAVIMMDLDGMKRVNDQLGHGGGDAVLQAISASLQEALRDRDSIARMGGDEFCILLPDTEMQEALVVAERLRAQVEALAIRYRGETIYVRASFGVCSSEKCGWNWQTLMDESDAALYEAKRSGHNKVIGASTRVAVEVAVPEEPLQAVVSDRRRR
ncbi:MAG: GGDEF domain-containing protein [Acidobacteriaceae bacterium]